MWSTTILKEWNEWNDPNAVFSTQTHRTHFVSHKSKWIEVMILNFFSLIICALALYILTHSNSNSSSSSSRGNNNNNISFWSSRCCSLSPLLSPFQPMFSYHTIVAFTRTAPDFNPHFLLNNLKSSSRCYWCRHMEPYTQEQRTKWKNEKAYGLKWNLFLIWKLKWADVKYMYTIWCMPKNVF